MDTEIKETLLYRGEVKIIFDESTYTLKNGETYKKHIYFRDSVKPENAIDGVTSVLNVIAKPQLVPWATKITADFWKDYLVENKYQIDEVSIEKVYKESKKASDKVKNDAADHGTLLHKWMEAFLKGQNPEPLKNPALKKSAEQFLEWMERHKVIIKSAERMVYSKAYNYVGTVDDLGSIEIDGVKYSLILDLKTSSGIYDSHLLQIAAYRGCLQEEFGIAPERGAIVCCKKDGTLEYRVWSADDMDRAYNAFIGALAIHRWQKSMKRTK